MSSAAPRSSFTIRSDNPLAVVISKSNRVQKVIKLMIGAETKRGILPLRVSLPKFSIVALFAAISLIGCNRRDAEPHYAEPRSHPGAAEWTRFRGPNGSGLGNAPGLPASFGASDFNWRVELPGGGHSSPVIWGDRLFVTTNPKGSTKRVVVCMNAQDGKTLWTRTYNSRGYNMVQEDNYAASSPAVDAERVYFHWASPRDSGLVALDQDDGHEVWKVDLGPCISEIGSGTSPIVFEDMVILNFDQDKPKSFLLAVDAKTGKQRWRWEHEGTRNTPATPCVFLPKTGAPEILVDTFTLGMCAIDAHAGTLIWQIPDLMKKRCVASPFVTDTGLIFAQCGEGPAETFLEVARPAADGRSAEKVYEILHGGNVPTPIVVDGLLFLWKENGFVTCARAGNNEQVWRERVRDSFYGSPVCVNHRLYIMSTRGDLIAIAAGNRFQLIARIPLGEGSSATPAISGGRMYLRTFTHLISVGRGRMEN